MKVQVYVEFVHSYLHSSYGQSSWFDGTAASEWMNWDTIQPLQDLCKEVLKNPSAVKQLEYMKKHPLQERAPRVEIKRVRLGEGENSLEFNLKKEFCWKVSMPEMASPT